MTPFHIAFVVISLSIQDSPAARPDCREWQECRQLALDAAARQEYETFHDLAWRAVQKGPRNDPALMYLLARAQSLSGRPDDALVMLERLAQMGVSTDAETNDDFRRVRALPAWADRRTSAGATRPVESPSGALPAAPALPKTGSDSRHVSAVDTAPIRADHVAEPPTVAPRGAREGRTSPAVSPAESLRFTTEPFTPAGLAYDAVSRRFIVGDREARKLAVVDEFSQHVANLASAQSAGFGILAALEIDPRQGNLWVVSASGAMSGPLGVGQTVLHKLQLVSGRVLASYALPERFGDAAFVDVAAASDSTVLVLDRVGHRVFRLRPRSQELELAATLADSEPVSIAPADSRIYVATKSGISALDPDTRSVTPLSAATGVDLDHITRLRSYKGSLVAIQESAGSYRAVRIALDGGGHRARSMQILDAALPTTDPTAATVAGGVLYYLASGDGAEMIVRKVTLP